MNARELTEWLQFVGGKPMLILRDHEGGRIKVFQSGEWIATVGPGSLLGLDEEAFFLGKTGDIEGCEERTTWGGIAALLSQYQQTGEVPVMDADGFIVEE